MKIRLNLYLPQLHEDFYATWQRRSTSRVERRWSTEIPLVVDNAVVGTLSVVGVQVGGSIAPVLVAFSELVEPLESQLTEVLEEHREKFSEKTEDSEASAVTTTSDPSAAELKSKEPSITT